MKTTDMKVGEFYATKHGNRVWLDPEHGTTKHNLQGETRELASKYRPAIYLTFLHEVTVWDDVKDYASSEDHTEVRTTHLLPQEVVSTWAEHEAELERRRVAREAGEAARKQRELAREEFDTEVRRPAIVALREALFSLGIEDDSLVVAKGDRLVEISVKADVVRRLASAITLGSVRS
jgi:hypothetical protein